MSPISVIAQSLTTALGCGLLIGLERERRKGHGPDRLPAGIRTFSLAAVCGAVAGQLNQPFVVVAAAVLIGIIAAIAAYKRRGHDPGVTTALALLLTYLLGVLAVTQPLLAAATSVVVTALLAARGLLHRFSTTLLTEQELRDGLLLGAVGLIAIPLAPDTPLTSWVTTTPRRVVELVLLFMSLQALAYIAQRIAGARLGIVFSGLLGGFVSSTATITAFGARARATSELNSTYVAGALASNVTTVILLLVVTMTIYPPALAVLGAPLLAGLLAACLVAGAGLVNRTHSPAPEPPPGRAFHPLHAVAFALAITGTSAALSAAIQSFGPAAADVTAILGGLLDVHALTASTLSLGAAHQLSLQSLAVPVLLAWSANTTGKLIGAWLGGGARYTVALAVGLSAPVAAAWAVLWLR